MGSTQARATSIKYSYIEVIKLIDKYYYYYNAVNAIPNYKCIDTLPPAPSQTTNYSL